MSVCTAQTSETSIDMAKAKKLWIHCNCCYVHYVDQHIVFLLACQHVACEKCVVASLGRSPGDAPSYLCPICHKKVRGRQINNALPPNLKDMFHPEPWLDGLPHDLIDNFQRAHQKRLEEHIARKRKEGDKLDKDMQLAYKVCQKHYLEMHQNRMTRKQLEFRARQIKYQVAIKKKESQRRLLQRQKCESIKASPSSRSFPRSDSPLNAGDVADDSLFSAIGNNGAGNPLNITSFAHHKNNSFIL